MLSDFESCRCVANVALEATVALADERSGTAGLAKDLRKNAVVCALYIPSYGAFRCVIMTDANTTLSFSTPQVHVTLPLQGVQTITVIWR